MAGTIVDGLSRVFDALANEHRREIILHLARQPRSISSLAALRGLSLPAMNKHVRVLEDAGMISRRKVGRTTYLALEREPLVRLQAWTGLFNPWWGTDGDSLANYADAIRRNPPSPKETS